MAGEDVKKREPYPLLVGTSTCSHRRARRQPLRKVHTATQPCTPGTRPMQTETDVRSSPFATAKVSTRPGVRQRRGNEQTAARSHVD